MLAITVRMMSSLGTSNECTWSERMNDVAAFVFSVLFAAPWCLRRESSRVESVVDFIQLLEREQNLFDLSCFSAIFFLFAVLDKSSQQMSLLLKHMFSI